jgi:hypothetical protein
MGRFWGGLMGRGCIESDVLMEMVLMVMGLHGLP